MHINPMYPVVDLAVNSFCALKFVGRKLSEKVIDRFKGFQNRLLLDPQKCRSDQPYPQSSRKNVTQSPSFYRPQGAMKFHILSKSWQRPTVFSGIMYHSSTTCRGAVLYLHGRGVNVGTNTGAPIQFLRDKGYDVYLLEYQGCGKEIGKADLEETARDIHDFWEVFTDMEKYKRKEHILYGHSLGAAFATQLAANPDVKPTALILEAPFYNMIEMVKKQLRVVPHWIIHKILFFPLKNNENIQKVTCPLLIAHCKKDRMNPFIQGKKLFYEAEKAAFGTFVELDGKSHCDLINKPKYQTELSRFLDRISVKPA